MRSMVMRVPDIVAMAMAMAVASGCAHPAPNRVVVGSELVERQRSSVPACFSGPLMDCVGDPSLRTPAEVLGSPWLEPYEPDLAHRVCRGDRMARKRWLEGARRLTGEDDPRARSYRAFLGRCSDPGFCGWAVDTAGDEAEAMTVRVMLTDHASQWCDDAGLGGRVETTAVALGRSRPVDRRSTQEIQCAGLERLDDPWDDLLATSRAGCLDLGGWIERHRDRPEEIAAALETCVEGSEIRYQEAPCLRELAALDRDRAVALVRAPGRRGWGISSPVTAYARTLQRFPEPGELEAELRDLGLISSGDPTTDRPGSGAILPTEVLERSRRLIRFNPSCSDRYCEHAPMLYRLIDLVSPALDDVVLAERWPALEEIDLGTGPSKVATSIGGIPVTLKLAESAAGSFDAEAYESLRTAIEEARRSPHLLTAYARGRSYRLHIRQLGGWYDLEAMIAGLNAILADRGSDLRYATLDPHCAPCAVVVAGPRDGLAEASFRGLIEVVEPFRSLWTYEGFDPRTLSSP